MLKKLLHKARRHAPGAPAEYSDYADNPADDDGRPDLSQPPQLARRHPRAADRARAASASAPGASGGAIAATQHVHVAFNKPAQQQQQQPVQQQQTPPHPARQNSNPKHSSSQLPPPDAARSGAPPSASGGPRKARSDADLVTATTARQKHKSHRQKTTPPPPLALHAAGSSSRTSITAHHHPQQQQQQQQQHHQHSQPSPPANRPLHPPVSPFASSSNLRQLRSPSSSSSLPASVSSSDSASRRHTASAPVSPSIVKSHSFVMPSRKPRSPAPQTAQDMHQLRAKLDKAEKRLLRSMPPFLELDPAEMTDRFRKIQDAQKLRLQRIATAASSVSSSSAASLQPAPLCDPRLGWCFNDALNNMDRNRYSNILPFDNNRIRIAVVPAGNDYINASLITLDLNAPVTSSASKKSLAPSSSAAPALGSKQYIATQGPTRKTVPHFWHMLYSLSEYSSQFQADSMVVLMLTPLAENGREACEQYWPRTRGAQLDVPADPANFPLDLKVVCTAVNKYKGVIDPGMAGMGAASTNGGPVSAPSTPASASASPASSSYHLPSLRASPSSSSLKRPHSASSTSPAAKQSMVSSDDYDAGPPTSWRAARSTAQLHRLYPHTHTVLSLTCPRDGRTKTIHHLYVDSWGDFAAPKSDYDIANLVALTEALMQESSGNGKKKGGPTGKMPLVVHCSAGVGRTGTYTVLDYMLTRSKLLSDSHSFSYPPTTPLSAAGPAASSSSSSTHPQQNPPASPMLQTPVTSLMTMAAQVPPGSDPVHELVSQLRLQRIEMVQNKHQYQYIYGAVRRAYWNKQWLAAARKIT